MKHKPFVLLLSLMVIIGCKSRMVERHYEKAFELEEMGQYEEAIVELNKAINIKPNFEQAILDRAIDKSILGNYQDAIKDLNTFIKLRPDAIESYVWRAEFKRMIELYEEALIDSEYALELKRNNILAENLRVNDKKFDIELKYILYERGCANFHLGNYDTSFKDINYCITENQNLKDCYYMRGMIYVNSEMLIEACSDFRAANRIEKGYTAMELVTYCNEN